MLALVLVLLSAELVTVIFARGQFSLQDAAVVSKFNSLYVLQAPVFLIGILYGRLLLVEGHSRDLFVGAIISVGLAIAANLILAPIINGAGIPVAATIAYAASAIWLRMRLSAVLRERRIVSNHND